MTANLIVWKWGDAYQKPHVRRKEKLTNRSVVDDFMQSGDESRFGPMDQDAFEKAAKAELVENGFEEDDVLIERYGKCVVFNMALAKRDSLLPLIGSLAMRHGLNGTEA